MCAAATCGSDVSDPTQPRVVNTHKTQGIAQDVHVTGSLALVANGYNSNGLRLIDVSNPLQPKDVGHYDMPGIAYGAFAADKHASVVSIEQDEEDEAGLTVLDISDPTRPSPDDAQAWLLRRIDERRARLLYDPGRLLPLTDTNGPSGRWRWRPSSSR